MAETYTFPTLEARDRWIEARYPDRTATETPGLYETPAGECFGVFCYDVTVYRQSTNTTTNTGVEPCQK